MSCTKTYIENSIELSESRALRSLANNPDLTQAAKTLAFYTAMLKACKTDPLDDPKDQEIAEQLITDRFQTSLDAYTDLMNELF